MSNMYACVVFSLCSMGDLHSLVDVADVLSVPSDWQWIWGCVTEEMEGFRNWYV